MWLAFMIASNSAIVADRIFHSASRQHPSASDSTTSEQAVQIGCTQ